MTYELTFEEREEMAARGMHADAVKEFAELRAQVAAEKARADDLDKRLWDRCEDLVRVGNENLRNSHRADDLGRIDRRRGIGKRRELHRYQRVGGLVGQLHHVAIDMHAAKPVVDIVAALGQHDLDRFHSASKMGGSRSPRPQVREERDLYEALHAPGLG